MLDKIREFILQNNIAQPPTTAVVGISGGADSVVLTSVLADLDYPLQAVHCNFHLRGEESMRDEKFVRNFCAERNIPLDVVDFDTTAYAKNNGISVEMAARDLRYNYFEKIRQTKGDAEIFIAHHYDDSIETMLMNLIRGTGLNGMCGIKPVNGHIIRPLLCVSRHEIEQYAVLNKLDYITDSTNLENDYTRNKIRNLLLPLLKEINPEVIKALLHDMENFSAANEVCKSYCEARLTEIVKNTDGAPSIDAEKLAKEPHKEFLLHYILSNYGFNPATIKKIAASAEAENGKKFFSKDFALVKEYGLWMLLPRKNDDENEVEEQINLNDVLSVYQTTDTTIIKDPGTAVFDAAKLKYPLTLRRWQNSDKFQPFGMKGKTKNVSDLLNELKIPAAERSKVLVLISDEKIAWVVGYRTDERFKIDSNTKTVIRATIKASK